MTIMLEKNIVYIVDANNATMPHGTHRNVAW